jgi:anti-sigma-K factor RskA
MTDHHDTNDVHALSGAYAVDAVDDVERARFEAHLRSCPDCRTEVDSLREAAALLALDPVDPPARLRADVLAGIESIRPLPPLTSAEPRLDKLGVRAQMSRLGIRGPLLVAAALVLVALVTTVTLRPWADDERGVQLDATARVLTAPDADQVVQELPDGSRATVVVSRSQGRAVILTDDMALAPDGKDYQLWLQTPEGTMVPAGLMPDESDATVLLDGDASKATAVGITVEPDGGSKEPGPDLVTVIELDA